MRNVHLKIAWQILCTLLDLMAGGAGSKAPVLLAKNENAVVKQAVVNRNGISRRNLVKGTELNYL